MDSVLTSNRRDRLRARGRPRVHASALLARMAAALLASGLVAGLALAQAPPAGASRGRGTVGGPQLADTGVVVNYPGTQAKPLPKVKAACRAARERSTE